MAYLDTYTLELFNVYNIIFIILVVSLLYDLITNLYDDTYVGKEEKSYIEYINTAHSGLIRGLIFGFILGDLGLDTGIKNAAVYGMANPIFMYLGY